MAETCEQQPSAAGGAPLALTLVTLGGEELASLSADPSWRLQDVLRAAGVTASVLETASVLHGEEELGGERTLADLGVLDGARLSLVRGRRSCVLLCAGMDGFVRLLCAESGVCLRAFEVREVCSLAFSPDHAKVVTASMVRGKQLRYAMRIWSTSDGLCTQSIEDLIAGHRTAFSPDGEELLAVKDGSTVGLWSVASGSCVGEFQGGERDPWSQLLTAVFSPDGRQVLTSSRNGETELWCRASRQRLRSFDGDFQHHTSLFPCDGEGFLVRHKGCMEFWSSDPLELRQALGQAHSVFSAALSPRGDLVIFGNLVGDAELWSVAAGKLLWSVHRAHQGTFYAAFTPDAQHVATAGKRCLKFEVRVWSTETGACVVAMPEVKENVVGLSFSRDGQLLLTCSERWTAQIWAWASAECLSSWESRCAVLSR